MFEDNPLFKVTDKYGDTLRLYGEDFTYYANLEINKGPNVNLSKEDLVQLYNTIGKYLAEEERNK